jgi:hypothetical protein
VILAAVAILFDVRDDVVPDIDLQPVDESDGTIETVAFDVPQVSPLSVHQSPPVRVLDEPELDEVEELVKKFLPSVSLVHPSPSLLM